MKLRKVISFTIFNVGAVTLVLVVAEGLLSFATVGKTMLRTTSLAERRHTTHDDLLGWINQPDVLVPDMYGKGVYLRTNPQCFRNNTPTTPERPRDTVRVICSGDSFTLGYGVDNDHTWCQELASANPRIESVNMGQGGYGVDQAYLWYKRDGLPLEHDVHIFAFVRVDFDRMMSDRFQGYPKPKLEIEDGKLAVRNVPVPYPRAWPVLLAEWDQAVQRLALVRGLRKLVGTDDAGSDPLAGPEAVEKTGPIVASVFADLQQLNLSKHSTLLLVYLPMRRDYLDGWSDLWREATREDARRLGVHFVDLVEAIRRLPQTQVRSFFIAEGAMDYPGAAGHYTEAGNAFVAEQLSRELRELPGVSEGLRMDQGSASEPGETFAAPVALTDDLQP